MERLDNSELIVEKITKIVNSVLKLVPLDMVFVRSRKREIITTRQTVQYFLLKHTRINLKEIGRLTGGFDHATVIHSVKQISNLKDTDRLFEAKMHRIEILIHAELKEMLNKEDAVVMWAKCSRLADYYLNIITCAN